MQSGEVDRLLWSSDASLVELLARSSNSTAWIWGAMMVIAERILTISGADPVQVPVRLFAPTQSSAEEWSCRGEIVWPDRKMDINAAGLDSAQALVLALQMIGSALYSSSYHEAGSLLWDRTGGGYGFPIAGTLRDLLQGEDKKFF